MKKIWTILCLSILFAGCAYDDADVWDSIDDIHKKIKALEEKMNDEISALHTIVDALDTGKTITAVTQSTAGYTVTFSDGTTISVMSSAAGAEIPVIGVKEENGVYYWTITKNGSAEWLTDSKGNKFPVAGVTPQIGVDGEGYWTIDTGNGPVRVTDQAGNPIKASGEKGDSFFQSVTQTDTEVTFILSDGTEIVIPKTVAVNLVINGGRQQYFYFEESRLLTMELTGNAEITISKPDGWRVKTEGNALTITAPAESNPYAETEGEIAIIAIGETSAIAKIRVVASAYQAPSVFTFEEVPAAYLPGPTAKGENLYSDYTEGSPVISYHDASSDLVFSINESYGSYNFWNGGIVASRWNETTGADWNNQCSVYYQDAGTGFGGHGGSQTFGIVNGNDATAASLYFQSQDTEKAIDHIWVMNSTYAALAMIEGNGYARSLSYENEDWFKLIVAGYDKAGNKTGEVEFYLADFRTPNASGVLTAWSKVDLASLGAVNKLVFDLKSTDIGQYGMNTPGYFCLDDIAIRR